MRHIVSMMFLTAAVSLFGARAQGALAQPANLQNAKISTVPVVPGDLARVVGRALSDGEARWVGWAAPSIDRRNQMCCFDSTEWMSTGSDGRACCGRCALESRGASLTNREGSRAVRLEDPSEFLILIHGENGGADRVRVFSLDCEIDGGGRPVTWLTGVKSEEGVAFLESLVLRTADERRSGDNRVCESAISAIALQPGAAADLALTRLIAADRPVSLRKKVAFWLGNSRGRAGYDILRAAVAADSSREFRKHATFAFSQSPVPEAVTTLLEMAKKDDDPAVRGQALFWLAQKAGRKAAGAIEDSIQNDPDTEVKRKAVFALAQLPKDEGIPQLIRVARTNRNPEVRRQAVFWLGQSKDPRAIDFIEEVLTH